MPEALCNGVISLEVCLLGTCDGWNRWILDLEERNIHKVDYENGNRALIQAIEIKEMMSSELLQKKNHYPGSQKNG